MSLVINFAPGVETKLFRRSLVVVILEVGVLTGPG